MAYDYSNFPTAFGTTAASQGLFTAYQFMHIDAGMRRQLMDRHPGLKNNFYSTLKELGLGTPSSSPEVSHMEKDWVKNNFAIGAIVTAPTGPGEPGVYRLDAGSMYTTTVNGYGQMSFSYPSEREIVILPNGVQALIMKKDQTKNPHELTLKPLKANETLVGAITVGSANRIWIGPNASVEGSTGVESKMARYYKYVNNHQIIRSSFGITGTELTNKLPFVNIDGAEGSFLIEGTTDTEILQMSRISDALLWGVKSDNVTAYSEMLKRDAPVLTTQGLDDYIVQEGNTLNLTNGEFGVPEIDLADIILTREKIATNTLLMPLGGDLRRDFSNNMKDFMKDTCFDFAKGSFPNVTLFDETNRQDLFPWLDFAGVRKNNRNWLAKGFSELDNFMGAGSEGYNKGKTGYILPIEIVDNPGGKNPKIPSIGYEYKSLGGYGREYEMWKHGGAGPITKTTDLDGMMLEWLSEIAGHWALGNAMIKLK